MKESESLSKTSLPEDKVCSCRKSDGPIIEDSTSDNKKDKQVMSKPEVVKKARTRIPKIVKHNADRPKTNEKHVRQPVRYCEQYRTINKPKGNQRNWYSLKSLQQRDNKVCYTCGSFDHLAAFCNQ